MKRLDEDECRVPEWLAPSGPAQTTAGPSGISSASAIGQSQELACHEPQVPENMTPTRYAPTGGTQVVMIETQPAIGAQTPYGAHTYVVDPMGCVAGHFDRTNTWPSNPQRAATTPVGDHPFKVGLHKGDWGLNMGREVDGKFERRTDLGGPNPNPKYAPREYATEINVHCGGISTRGSEGCQTIQPGNECRRFQETVQGLQKHPLNGNPEGGTISIRRPFEGA